jgi:hypothetical protein
MSEYYLIHTKTNETVVARGNFNSTNANTVGQTNTYTFYLNDNITYTQDTTIQSGDIVEYDNIVVESGVTLTINGTLQCNNITVDGDVVVNGDLIVTDTSARNTLLSYGEWAGKYNTNTMIDATVKYTERIPTSESIDSLVVGIEPASDLQNKDVVGAWGIIDSIQDLRNGPLGTDRIELQITTLAKYSDYSDVSGVENSLKLA